MVLVEAAVYLSTAVFTDSAEDLFEHRILQMI
jgi:hypothetical protein